MVSQNLSEDSNLQILSTTNTNIHIKNLFANVSFVVAGRPV